MTTDIGCERAIVARRFRNRSGDTLNRPTSFESSVVNDTALTASEAGLREQLVEVRTSPEALVGDPRTETNGRGAAFNQHDSTPPFPLQQDQI